MVKNEGISVSTAAHGTVFVAGTTCAFIDNEANHVISDAFVTQFVGTKARGQLEAPWHPGARSAHTLNGARPNGQASQCVLLSF